MKFKNGKELWNYIEQNHEAIEEAMAETEDGDPYGWFIDLAFQVQNHEEEIASIRKEKNRLGQNIAFWGMLHEVEQWRDEALNECTKLLNQYMKLAV